MSSCHAATVPELWELAVLQRKGLPPLRFMGQRKTALRRTVMPDKELVIELWARRKGGFVLTYSDAASATLQSQAFVFAQQDEALEHLEALCTNASPEARQPNFAAALSEILHAASLQQQFAIMVGEFLAALDEIDECFSSDNSMKEV